MVKNTIMKKRIIALLADTVILASVAAAVLAVSLLSEVRLLIPLVILIVLALLYPVLFELSGMAATPGLYMMGLYVRCNGMRVSTRTILVRSLWRFVSCIPLGVGFFYGFISGDRTVYDIMSETTVVRRTAAKGRKAVPCVYKKLKGGGYKSYIIKNGGVLFGRNPKICDILFNENEAGISRCHCSLMYNEQTNMFLLEDMGSSFGTFIGNGTKIEPGKLIALNPDEKFYLAKTECEFKVGFCE